MGKDFGVLLPATMLEQFKKKERLRIDSGNIEPI
jgi:hypothetical protein